MGRPPRGKAGRKMGEKIGAWKRVPYDYVLSAISKDAQEVFRRAFRPKKRGVGIMKTERAKKLGTEEYYVARMVEFYCEPWDNIPVVALCFTDKTAKKRLDPIINEITQAILEWINKHDPETFEKMWIDTVYVASLYGLFNVKKL